VDQDGRHDEIRQGWAQPAAPAVRQALTRSPAAWLAGVVPTGSRADTVGFLVAWFVLLAIGIEVAAAVVDNLRVDWWSAYDTNAYWLAARHIVDGSPLYQQAEIWTAGAYKYPPLFAQIVFPIGLVPEPLVDWTWRIVGVLCLRYLCGSWKLAVVATFQWLAFAELGFGNVTLQLGAASLACFGRGRTATAGILLLPWFAGMKVGPGLLIPYLWITRPETRRMLVASCGIFAAACLGSFVLAPGLWFDYFGTFDWEAASQMQAMHVLAIFPDRGGLDFVVRLALGLVALLAAIRWRLDWLAFTIAAATMPIFSLTRLAILVGLWPLWLRGLAADWRAGGGSLARWLTSPLVYLDMLPPATPTPHRGGGDAASPPLVPAGAAS